MKKTLILLLALLTAACSCGCRDMWKQDANGKPDTEAPATDIPATEEPEWEPVYFGPEKAYSYTTEKGTSARLLEEDIIQFANDLLNPYNGHPLLTDRDTSVGAYYSNTLQGCTTSLVNMYDPALREEFIRRINELIRDLPTFDSDYPHEAVIRLAEAAAILHDTHTSLFAYSRYELPLRVYPFFSDDGCELRVIGVPADSGLDDIIYSRIDAINGVPIAECAERISACTSYEADSWRDFQLYEFNSYPFILDAALLRYYGIMEGDSAELTLTDLSGGTRKVGIASAVRGTTRLTFWDAGADALESDIGLGLMWDNYDRNEWCKLLSDGETIYLRIFSCYPQSMSNTLKELKALADEAGGVKQVIVDFRSNFGGSLSMNGSSYDVIQCLKGLDLERVCVLIDHGSCSSATINPAHIVRVMDNAILVGMKSAQPTRFFYGGPGTLKNSGISYSMSHKFSDFWPGNEDDALTPDVTVYQTLEDLMRGVDSVLDWVVNGGAEN